MIGFDFETHPIGPGAVLPAPVCLSTYADDTPALYHHNDTPGALAHVLRQPGPFIAHNAAFDLAVAIHHYPTIAPLVWAALDAGLCQCTFLREKLLRLATTGQLVGALGYALGDLTKHYLRLDITDTKTADAWRMHYQYLAPYPIAQWPDAAINYAVGDAVYAVRVYQAQEARAARLKAQRGIDVFKTAAWQVKVAVALQLMAMRGFKTDRAYYGQLAAEYQKQWATDNYPLLLATGILQREQPAQPYKNKAKAHTPGCDRKPGCGCPLKLRAPVPAKISKKQLLAYVGALGWDNYVYTEKGQLSVNKAWLADNWGRDSVLEEYYERQKLAKMITTELPRFNAPVVYTSYDTLKATGRTSSRASKLYPSANIQNVDPRARGCVVARDGYWLVSSDYAQMELGTLAQTCLTLFGYSVLADLINAGVDVHAYLGAQLAAALDPGFAAVAPADPMDRYQLFTHYKTGHLRAQQALYKNYRKFAKPTGLGYPGGLGAATFVTYAKGTYGVDVDEPTAKRLKDIWLETYPEMREYFRYINKKCKDPWNKHAERGALYGYTTPMGMVRAGAFYTAAANGLGLQSPSAEGAKAAVYAVVKAAHTPGNPLHGNYHPIAFVHDELVGEIRCGTQNVVVPEIERIMVACMRVVTPDVAARVESALMTRWDKAAEPVHDANGGLVLWRPKEKGR